MTYAGTTVSVGGTALTSTAAAVTPVTIDAANVSSVTTTTTPVALAFTTGTTDVLLGTAANDTFTGTATTFDLTDMVIDSSTTDNDTLNIDETATIAVTAPTVTNVENVNITFATTNRVNPQVLASSFSGVKNLTVTGTNVIVGGASIAGDKDVDVQNVDATKVLKVTTGVATNDVTVVQATKAGITVDAATAVGEKDRCQALFYAFS